MEGPTPVSIIHAATMVTAGVLLLLVVLRVFEYAPVHCLLLL